MGLIPAGNLRPMRRLPTPTVRLLASAALVLSVATGCSGDDEDEPDQTPDPTLAGPSESLVAPPGTGDPVVEISETKVCSDSPVSGGKADGRFYGSVTNLAGGSLKLTVAVDGAKRKKPKERAVEVLVDDGGRFVALFPVYAVGETLTLSDVEASGLVLEAPDASLEVRSLDGDDCEVLDLPIPPIPEDD